MTTALADTSVFIALESGRDIDFDAVPQELRVSVVTLAELEAGVLAAADLASRSQRLRTLEMASETEPLHVTPRVASEWARLRVELHGAGRKTPVNDLWIAAIARANDLPVLTQDDDFDALADLDLLRVIKI